MHACSACVGVLKAVATLLLHSLRACGQPRDREITELSFISMDMPFFFVARL